MGGVPARPLLLTAGVFGSVAAAIGIPALEMALAWRGPHPVVPGPHDVNGIVNAGSAGPMTEVVWLGDSLSSGVGADSPEEAFPRQVAALVACACAKPVHLTCLAAPGARTTDVLSNQLPMARAFARPGVTALVAVGSNDVAHAVPLRAFRARYAAIVADLQATGATVVCIGLPDLSSAVVLAQPLRAIAGWAGRRADRVIASVAADAGAHYVSISSRPPELARHHIRAFLSADRWHPNGAGYRVWAAIVSERLSELWSGPLVGVG